MSSSDFQLHRKIPESFPILETLVLFFFFCNKSSLVCLTKLKGHYYYLFLLALEPVFLHYWLAV